MTQFSLLKMKFSNWVLGCSVQCSLLIFVFNLLLAMFPYRHLLHNHEPEPENTTAEPEPDTIMPEIMTNQEAFLMYGIFIFALAVFCVVLLVMYILLKKK